MREFRVGAVIERTLYGHGGLSEKKNLIVRQEEGLWVGQGIAFNDDGAARRLEDSHGEYKLVHEGYVAPVTEPLEFGSVVVGEDSDGDTLMFVRTLNGTPNAVAWAHSELSDRFAWWEVHLMVVGEVEVMRKGVR